MEHADNPHEDLTVERAEEMAAECFHLLLEVRAFYYLHPV